MLEDLGVKLDAEQQSWSQKLSDKEAELSQVKQGLDSALKQLGDSQLYAQVSLIISIIYLD